MKEKTLEQIIRQELLQLLKEEAKSSDKEVFGVDTLSDHEDGKISGVPGIPVATDEPIEESTLRRWRKIAGIKEQMDMDEFMPDDDTIDAQNTDAAAAAAGEGDIETELPNEEEGMITGEGAVADANFDAEMEDVEKSMEDALKELENTVDMTV